jgi:hypothetical protein
VQIEWSKLWDERRSDRNAAWLTADLQRAFRSVGVRK